MTCPMRQKRHSFFRSELNLYEPSLTLAIDKQFSPILVDFGFEYKYEIEFENELSTLASRLHTIT